MQKLDLYKTDKTYYHASSKPQLIEIAPARYISILGKGDPSAPLFSAHVQALYGTAYQLKFSHKAQDNDFIVPKLEGLWWYDEKQYQEISMAEAPMQIPRSQWQYRLMIRLPDFVSIADVENATAEVFTKKQLPYAKDVAYFELFEGKCIQILHTGPFSEEPKTLAIIANFANEHGLVQNGLHHEIYLSDFRKTSAEKLRTILREPVK